MNCVLAELAVVPNNVQSWIWRVIVGQFYNGGPICLPRVGTNVFVDIAPGVTNRQLDYGIVGLFLLL